MKKLILPLFIVIAATFFVASPAQAQEKAASRAAEKMASKAAQAQERVASKAADRLDARLTKIMERGGVAVDTRVTKLEALLTLISNATFLKTEDKTALTNNVQAQIEELKSTKTKLDAEATADAAKADYMRIFNEFRVFTVFIPQMHATLLIDHANHHIDLLSQFGTKLNTRITKAKTDGLVTTQLETLFVDYTGRVSSAKTKVDAAAKLIPQLSATQSATTSAKVTLTNIRTQLKAAHEDIKLAHKTAADILSGLKSLKLDDKTATKSASASAKPASASAKVATTSANTASSSAKVATTSATR